MQTLCKEKETRKCVSLSCGSPKFRSNQHPFGQKHSRTTRLERFVLLLVSSCAKACCFSPRERKRLRQLTAARLFTYSNQNNVITQRKRDSHLRVSFVWLPKVSLEPTTLSVRNIVARLAWSASSCSLFLPAQKLAVSRPASASSCAS